MNIGKANEYVEFKESLTEYETGIKFIFLMLCNGYDEAIYFDSYLKNMVKEVYDFRCNI